MPSWLLKTEPSTYAWADLERDRRTRWDGVTNAQAQANLRAMRTGDRVVLYHSGSKEAVGWARVARSAYPDPGDGAGRRVAVDVAAVAPLPRPVALSALRDEPAFAASPLLRQGRLSVVPLTVPQWKALERLARRPRRPASLGE
jgi:predicted RNA-binding protein with PUA-like domain